jgi:radical SAM enzyme (TIGR01210 family)
MVDTVRRGLASITVAADELLVSPSGSMLDEVEVPGDARRKLYALLHDFPARKVLIETRAETVTDTSTTEFATSLPNKHLGVELGLESCSPWVLRFCVNKGSHPDEFVRAASVLKSHGIETLANVCVGTAWLSPGEAVEDAVRTARWALERGADRIVLFPLHAKPFTLLGELYLKGRYLPPSLWSLVEVLRRLGPNLTAACEIAWYRNYYARGYTAGSPTTCPECREKVLALLDQYRANQSYEVVAALGRLDCACKDVWREELQSVPTTPLAARTLEGYQWLVREFHLEEWWASHGADLQLQLWDGPPTFDPEPEDSLGFIPRG